MTLWRVMTLALVVAGAVWLLTWPGAQAIWLRASTVDPVVFVAVGLGLLGSHAARAQRLHAEWHRRAAVSRSECLRVSLLHSVAVNVMPLRSGELGFPWLLWVRWRVPVMQSATSLVLMRVQDAVVLVWLACLTAAAVIASAPQAAAYASWCLASLATLLFIAAVSSWTRRPAPPTAPDAHAGPIRSARWQALKRDLHASLAAATPQAWVWCLVNWLLKLASLGGLMALLGGVPALSGWSAALGGEAAAALPLQAPAGFGSYEAAATLGARLTTSVQMPAMLAAALAAHLFALAVTLAAGLLVQLLPAPAPLHMAGHAGDAS